MGVRNSPGGRPLSAVVPLRRTSFSACAKAGTDTAVTSTPCAPPPVCLHNLGGGASGVVLFTVTSAPSWRGKSELLVTKGIKESEARPGEWIPISAVGGLEPYRRAIHPRPRALRSQRLTHGAKDPSQRSKVAVLWQVRDIVADRLFSEAAIHGLAAHVLGFA